MTTKKLRILVADDSAQVRATLQPRLLARGFEVLLAEDGAQALKIAETETFDLLTTDFQMPAVNGLELAKRVRAIRPELPISLITGDPDFVGAETPANVDRLFTKPFQADEFSDLVKNFLLGIRR